MKTKVFCIGFHKTGTTSLAVALRTLGYNVTGPNGADDPDIEQHVLPMAHALVEIYDAFQDNPWPIIYKELDRTYPGSKFVLTWRDSESWINSVVQHFGRKETPMRRWIYGCGCPAGNEAIYVKRFVEHGDAVLTYFKDRPSDFLVLDLARGDGWDKLCPFLGLAVPEVPFPHANQASERKRPRSSSSKPGKTLVDRLARRVS